MVLSFISDKPTFSIQSNTIFLSSLLKELNTPVECAYLPSATVSYIVYGNIFELSGS